jgi:hypothetical protein
MQEKEVYLTPSEIREKVLEEYQESRTEATILRWMREGKFPSVTIGGQRKAKWSDVVKFFMGGFVPAE